MIESRLTRVLLRLGAGATLAFIYVPLILIGFYAFNESVTQSWPIENFSTKWFSVAYHNEGVRDALWLSVLAALGATAVALVLGTLVSLAVSRYRFFGRETISLVVILPIALPGIITGLALQTTYTTVGIDFSLLTIIIGHATFCIVVVYNNAAARLRRLAGSLEEASYDLGADALQTFRLRDLSPDAHGPARRRAACLRALLRRGDRHHLHRRARSRRCPSGSTPTCSGPTEQPIVNVVALFVIARLDHPRLARAAG